MIICRWLHRRPPRPSDEAIKEQREMVALRAQIEGATQEALRLLGENNFSARIRASYHGRHL